MSAHPEVRQLTVSCSSLSCLAGSESKDAGSRTRVAAEDMCPCLWGISDVEALVFVGKVFRIRFYWTSVGSMDL